MKITNDFENLGVAAAMSNLNAVLMITDDTEVDYLVRLAMCQLTAALTTNDVLREEAIDEMNNMDGGRQ